MSAEAVAGTTTRPAALLAWGIAGVFVIVLTHGHTARIHLVAELVAHLIGRNS
jgi:hypothetical protein